MENLALITKPEEVYLRYGVVKGKTDEQYRVVSETEVVRAGWAEGCLMEPDLGDLVLLSLDNQGEAFILNVLKRANCKKPASLRIKGNTALNVQNGRLAVFADDIHIAGKQDLSISATKMTFEAVAGHAKMGTFSFLGGFLYGRIAKVKTVVNRLDTFAERATQRLKRSYRFVEEFEESKIGRLRLLVKNVFSVRSKNSTIKAEKTVKVDGEKIYLG